MIHLLVLVLFFLAYRDRLANLVFVLHSIGNRSDFPVELVIYNPPIIKQNSSKVIQASTQIKSEGLKKVAEQKIEKKPRVEAKSEPAQKTVNPASKQEVKKEITKKVEPLTIPVGQNVSHLTDEFAIFQESLLQAWSPPEGIPAECGCTLTFHVNEGVIDKIEIVESSGVILFDILARNVLTEIEIPKWAWGRNITITFT